MSLNPKTNIHTTRTTTTTTIKTIKVSSSIIIQGILFMFLVKNIIMFRGWKLPRTITTTTTAFTIPYYYSQQQNDVVCRYHGNHRWIQNVLVSQKQQRNVCIRQHTTYTGSSNSNSSSSSTQHQHQPQQQQQQQIESEQRNNNEYGVDMDQDALMESDMLVAVDTNDVLIPMSGTQTTSTTTTTTTTTTTPPPLPVVTLSKKDGHTFNSNTPRAVLHRAFSFFLFNSKNQLLITKRSSTKITFPNVWTNTVCSHPLYGMVPNEVDIVNSDTNSTTYPYTFPGIKYAAQRKCKHELGIDPKFILHDKIQFITRYHYWAADTITYGVDTQWGEHEIDYILFYKTYNKNDNNNNNNNNNHDDDDDECIPIKPCIDEVSDYKFVTMDELKQMMNDPTLLWSPWFVGIMERGGWEYWSNLDNTLSGMYTNMNITYFDPPPEHYARYNLPSHTRHTGVMSRSL